MIHHRGGTTSEVLNTDAEGRLVLADALAYLAEQQPRCIVDTATLTGACMVALGTDIAGAFGNDDVLAQELVAAGTEVGEPIWQMPLWSGLPALIESKVADVKNIGKRYGGAITAACSWRNSSATRRGSISTSPARPSRSTSTTSDPRARPAYRCGRSSGSSSSGCVTDGPRRDPAHGSGRSRCSRTPTTPRSARAERSPHGWRRAERCISWC